jgi:hypothetical protein
MRTLVQAELFAQRGAAVPEGCGADGRTEHRIFQDVFLARPGLCLVVTVDAEQRGRHPLAERAEAATAVHRGNGPENGFVPLHHGIRPGVDQTGQGRVVVLLVEQHEGQVARDVGEKAGLAGRKALDVLDLDFDGSIDDRADGLADACFDIGVVFDAGRLAVTDLLQLLEVAVVPVGDPPVEFGLADVERHHGVDGRGQDSLRVFLQVGLGQNRAIGDPPDVPLPEAQRAPQRLDVARILDGVVAPQIDSCRPRITDAVGQASQPGFEGLLERFHVVEGRFAIAVKRAVIA